MDLRGGGFRPGISTSGSTADASAGCAAVRGRCRWPGVRSHRDPAPSSPVSRGNPGTADPRERRRAAPGTRRPPEQFDCASRARELHPRPRRTVRRSRPPPRAPDRPIGLPHDRRPQWTQLDPAQYRSCIRWRQSCPSTTTASNTSPASTSSSPASQPSDKRHSGTSRPSPRAADEPASTHRGSPGMSAAANSVALVSWICEEMHHDQPTGRTPDPSIVTQRPRQRPRRAAQGIAAAPAGAQYRAAATRSTRPG